MRNNSAATARNILVRLAYVLTAASNE